jgi:UDP-N-acetylmuramoylalanine--D-glutamate ligase
LPKPADDLYVLELSSYQLDLTDHLKCAVAVILNVTPDHLDRHGGLAGYVRAKRRVFRNQKADDCAIVGVDDTHCDGIFHELRKAGQQRVVPISASRRLTDGVFVEQGRLHDAMDGAAEPVADLVRFGSLPGQHNWQNAAAAYAAARAIGVAAEAAINGMRRFVGLPHRLELVGEIDGVRFINDSKATNPDAAARALASFERIFWIAGGKPKQPDLDAILPWLDRVQAAYLIGEAAPLFKRLLQPHIACADCGDLASAIARAAADAAADRGPAPVVLLAPACASFDQFANFEARGDQFRSLVGRLRQAPIAAAGGAG